MMYIYTFFLGEVLLSTIADFPSAKFDKTKNIAMDSTIYLKLTS